MSLKDQVWQALRRIPYPGYSRDIVSFGLVQRVTAVEEKGVVAVALAVAHLPAETQGRILHEVEQALRALPNVRSVEVVAVAPGPLRPSWSSRPAPQRGRGEGIEAKTRFIPVASGKGGVGKSTVTVNLAVALRKRGARVGIIDADVYGFSIPRMLGVEGRLFVEDGRILPLEREGVKVVSMGMLVEREEAVIWRGPLLHKMLSTFIRDVAWGDLDILLLDLPPGTGDVSLTIAQELPHAEMVIVTTPQVAATEVAMRAARMAEKVNMDIAGVIENMSYLQVPPRGERLYLFGRGGGKALAERIGAPLLAEIPLDPLVRECGDRGDPVVLAAPDAPVAQAFFVAADRLLALAEAARPRGESLAGR